MNRQQMTKYKDTNDRILIQEWFSKKGHHLTEGGYYDVDLEVMSLILKYLICPLIVYGIDGRKKIDLE